jgi:hypothetical protein
MANSKSVEVFVLKMHKVAMDGVGIKIKLLQKDTVDTVPSHLVERLINAEIVSKEIPKGIVQKKENIDEDIGEVQIEEYSKEYFLAEGKEKMLLFLESQEEEINEDATDEELAEQCVSLFED